VQVLTIGRSFCPLTSGAWRSINHSTFAASIGISSLDGEAANTAFDANVTMPITAVILLRKAKFTSPLEYDMKGRQATFRLGI